MEYKDHVQLAAQPPVGYVAAGPSRLVFALPDDAEQWPLDVASLLAWDRLTPRLAGNALPPDATTGPALVAPASDETALEVPYRLLLSPTLGLAGGTGPSPSRRASDMRCGTACFVPMAHPRGRARGADPSPSVPSGSGTSATRSRPCCQRRISVTWSPCPGTSGTTPSLQPSWALPFGSWVDSLVACWPWSHPIVPEPLQADHFAVGPLGAHVRMHGLFDFPAENQDPVLLQQLGAKTPSLQQYEHILGAGRDQWVKVVRRGYLDSGQRACVVKVTHRSFEPIVAVTGWARRVISRSSLTAPTCASSTRWWSRSRRWTLRAWLPVI